MRIQDRKWPKNLLITAMNDIPLEGIKTCIINEESSLERWLSMQQFLESRDNTKDILAQGGNILQVVHDIHDKLKDFQSKVAETQSSTLTRNIQQGNASLAQGPRFFKVSPTGSTTRLERLFSGWRE